MQRKRRERKIRQTLRTSHNHAAARRHVDARDRLVVALEFMLQGEFVSRAARVQLDVVVAGDGEGAPVGAEGVVGDGCVKEVVHFRRHFRVSFFLDGFWVLGTALGLVGEDGGVGEWREKIDQWV